MSVLDPLVLDLQDRTARRGAAREPALSQPAPARFAEQWQWRTDLVARSRQQIAASRALLAQPVRSAVFEPSGGAPPRPAPVERGTGRQAWDGRPTNPARSGWHWVEDGNGPLRPMLWRGADWPNPHCRDTWRDGSAVLFPGELGRGRCLGPVAVPDGVAAQLHSRLTAGAG